MSVEYQVIVGFITAVGVIVGGFWAIAWRLASNVAGQFEKRLNERFEAQDKARVEGSKVYQERLQRVETEHHELERSHMKLLAELPREYVRREDHIRFETVLNAKLDALHAEMRVLAERQQRS